jgi:CHAT domain-containing protein/tetratricopeptide (TPR) repeat protein
MTGERQFRTTFFLSASPDATHAGHDEVDKWFDSLMADDPAEAGQDAEEGSSTDWGEILILLLKQEKPDKSADEISIRLPTALRHKTREERGETLYWVAGKFLESFDRRGLGSDAEKGIRCATAALELLPADHSERAGCMRQLASALVSKFNRDGTKEDLDRAIELAQAASNKQHDSEERRPILETLAIAHAVRYWHSGRPHDIQKSVWAFEECGRISPGLRTSPDYLSRYGAVLVDRFDVTRSEDDLRNGFACLEDAIAVEGDDDMVRTQAHFQYGSALIRRYLSKGNMGDLNRAINEMGVALEAGPIGNLFRPSILHNLATALMMRFASLGLPGDIDSAVAYMTEAVALLLPNSPHREQATATLEKALRLKEGGGLRGLPSAMDAGVARTTEELVPTYPVGAITVSLPHGRTAFARGDWANAAKLFQVAAVGREMAFDRLPLNAGNAAAQAAAVRQRREFLEQFANIGPNTALSLLRAGNRPNAAEEAALAMEQGLQQTMQESFDLIENDLVRYAARGRSLDYFRLSRARLVELIEKRDRLGNVRGLADELAAASINYDLSVAEIRRAPGFETFLRPTELSLIRAAAARVPLVYIGATLHGGVAVVVPSADRPIFTFELPELTTGQVAHWATRYERQRDAMRSSQPLRPFLDELDLLLPKLWSMAMKRLCSVLPHHGIRTAVLIPYGGQLAQLPWHAAYGADPGHPDGRQYACDRIVWRYGPNARLLGPPQQWPRRSGSRAETLVVFHQGSPPTAESEAAAIRAAMKTTREARETDASVANVLRRWRDARYVHINAHGRADGDEPLRSHIELHGGDRLSVRHLLTEREPLAARLLVLSACSTAVTSGREGIDEIVSFPAAALRSGAGQVAASFWPVWDVATLELMRGFYSRLGRDECVDLAAALQASAREVEHGGAATSAVPIPPPASLLRRMFGRTPPAVPAPGRIQLSEGGSDGDPDAGRDNWNHPYFWAGFAIHGNADTVG